MRGAVRQIERRGAAVVLIGSGTPEQARAFREAFAGDLRVLVDPELVGYRALELRRAVVSSWRPRTLIDGVRALLAGFRPGSLEGDPLQLGGLFVVAPGNLTRYAYIARGYSDLPPLRDILRALDRPVAA